MGKENLKNSIKAGIICADDVELAPFNELLGLREGEERAMLMFRSGSLAGIDVTAVRCGVCKVNAAIAAQLLIDFFSVDFIINAGTAGGMDRDVRLLDTVISDRIAYHDVAEDILTESHPMLRENFFRADRRLYDAAKRYSRMTDMPMLFGTMVTGEQFVEDDKRDEINRKYAPLSVDMETAAIAHVCHVNGIPFLSVRTVTDTADHRGMKNFEKNCRRASEISAETVKGILEEYASGVSDI